LYVLLLIRAWHGPGGRRRVRKINDIAQVSLVLDMYTIVGGWVISEIRNFISYLIHGNGSSLLW
jgi:hypothetical protein